MAQHLYSFHGTRLVLMLEEKIAEGYNRFSDAFMAAQRRFKEEYGIAWTPNLPLELNCSDEDIEAHNAVGKIINLLCEVNGGSLEVTEDEFTSDHLIKVRD